jgi:ubiquinone/menaquinone biosynthesis C-methylase UbiE
VGLWGKIFAAVYDRMMAEAEKAGLSAHRRAFLSSASGRVLEIGGGTGANLPFYPDRVTELVIVEPEAPMAIHLERKLQGYRIPTRVVRAPAEQLPLETASFDCAVAALVLCTVRDPTRALAEVRRVLKPGGRLLFLEHVRSDDPNLARWQDRLRVPWSWLGCGCQCNRRTVDSIRVAGFAVTDLRREVFPKAAPLARPLVIGAAARD